MFWKLKVSSRNFTINFEHIKLYLWLLNVLVLLLSSKPVEFNYRHFFMIIQTKECVLTVNKSEITGEHAFNGDAFRGQHEYSKDKKIINLGIFADLFSVI